MWHADGYPAFSCAVGDGYPAQLNPGPHAQPKIFSDQRSRRTLRRKCTQNRFNLSYLLLRIDGVSKYMEGRDIADIEQY